MIDPALPLSYLAWLALFVAAAWLPPRRWQALAMTAVGGLWLAGSAPASLLAYGGLGLLAWLGARRQDRRGQALTLVALVAIALSFKALPLLPALATIPALHFIGFSFALLKAIHYVIDGRAGRLPRHSALDFALYLLFVPTLLVGPIVRYGDFHRQTGLRRWDRDALSLGLERVLFGYAKLAVVAGYLVNWKLANAIALYGEADTPSSLYLQCLRYGLNLYFSFAGMSDIAIGAARIAGMKIPENFCNPLAARSIVAFWQAWHITLSQWCRDYVFMPVAAATRRPAFAILTSMLVLGLWHELSARYVLWAGYHALGIVVCRLYGRRSAVWVQALGTRGVAAYRVLSWFLTFNFVIAGFLITSSPTAAAALRSLSAIWAF